MPKNKIVLIELDGASWNVIEPLAKQGKLPNIRKLINSGASGNLLSDPPLISPRLWVSIFTGKHSKKHGVEFFGNSSSMVKCKRIWDIFNEKGLSTGIFGSFVTWPPYPVNGFMIPSLFALGTETYPEEYSFLQELTLNERKKNKAGISPDGRKKSFLYYAGKMKTHGVSFKTLLDAGLLLLNNKLKSAPDDERYWKRATAHLKISTEIFLHLYNRYKPFFATIHIHICDAFAHRYWKYYEPDKFHDVDSGLVNKYRNIIPNAYMEADRMIGKIMQEAKDAVIMIVSDHGSDAMETSRTAYRLHVENFLTRFGLREKIIPANVGLMTFCYSSDAKFMEELQIIFEHVTFSDTGEKVFDVLQEKSLLGLRLSQKFWGKEINENRPVNLGMSGRCLFSELFLPQKMEVSGTHDKEGILIMSGPCIKEGIRLDAATIFDITPTALAIAGFPAARDMDGKVLTKAIRDDCLINNPLQFIDTYEQSAREGAVENDAGYEQIKGQLKSLGYL
jgi:predicted AlkP superfamily phosphohydrolase/phosphomutase